VVALVGLTALALMERPGRIGRNEITGRDPGPQSAT
jgi:hypothetical protein